MLFLVIHFKGCKGELRQVDTFLIFPLPDLTWSILTLIKQRSKEKNNDKMFKKMFKKIKQKKKDKCRINILYTSGVSVV